MNAEMQCDKVNTIFALWHCWILPLLLLLSCCSLKWLNDKRQRKVKVGWTVFESVLKRIWGKSGEELANTAEDKRKQILCMRSMLNLLSQCYLRISDSNLGFRRNIWILNLNLNLESSLCSGKFKVVMVSRTLEI